MVALVLWFTLLMREPTAEAFQEPPLLAVLAVKARLRCFLSHAMTPRCLQHKL